MLVECQPGLFQIVAVSRLRFFLWGGATRELKRSKPPEGRRGQKTYVSGADRKGKFIDVPSVQMLTWRCELKK
jgi:hypothetical protein